MKKTNYIDGLLRLEVVTILAESYGVKLSWVEDLEDAAGCYVDKRITLSARILDLPDEKFWSYFFHELAHHYSFIMGLFKRAYIGKVKDRIFYLDTMKMRNRVETFTDRLAKKLMAAEYPGLEYIAIYEGV